MSYRATAYEKLLREIVDDIDKLRKEHEDLIQHTDKASPIAVREGVHKIGKTSIALLARIYVRAKEVLRRD